MKNSKRFMYIAAALGVMLLIFYFSSHPYEKQDLKPVLDGVVNIEGLESRLSGYSFSYAGGEVSVERRGVAGFLEFFIRKGAHFAIFFFLGWFVMAALGLFVKKAMFSVALSALIVTAYAISDEIHQHFTGNRMPLFQDVVLDTVCGIDGVMSLWLYRKRKSKLRHSRRKPNKLYHRTFPSFGTAFFLFYAVFNVRFSQSFPSTRRVTIIAQTVFPVLFSNVAGVFSPPFDGCIHRVDCCGK